jgi:Domain of unknown function (DUF4328)
MPARVVIMLLVAYFVVTAIGVVSDWLELELINRLAEDQAAVTQAEADASDARQGLIGLLQLLIYLATGIMFIIWFRRAYRNLGAWGTESLRFEGKGERGRPPAAGQCGYADLAAGRRSTAPLSRSAPGPARARPPSPGCRRR